jgi:hypothetical protein
MTGIEYVSFTLQSMFKTLEVETQEMNDGSKLPIISMACMNGRFVPLYAHDDCFNSFRGSNGADYTFVSRKEAEAFLKVYRAWYIKEAEASLQESIGQERLGCRLRVLQAEMEALLDEIKN